MIIKVIAGINNASITNIVAFRPWSLASRETQTQQKNLNKIESIPPINLPPSLFETGN